MTDRPWLTAYPQGVPADIDTSQYPSLVALMDEACCVRHALEYQGTGHHNGNAAARDAVKKEALRKAKIGYHEIVAGHTTPTELRRLIDKLVPPPA